MTIKVGNEEADEEADKKTDKVSEIIIAALQRQKAEHAATQDSGRVKLGDAAPAFGPK